MIKDYSALIRHGIWSMITTPDGKYLFAGGDFGKLMQICVESLEVVHDYGQVQDDHISCLQTTRDSKYVITGAGMRVKRISIEDRAVDKDFGPVCPDYITAMKISGDQDKLFIGDLFGNLRLMSLADGTLIKDFGKSHDGEITRIVITLDEKFFLTSS
jgi:hypothetical protein